MNKTNYKVHCFFEQSGTFKNEFKRLGINSFDYDILNQFGETDFQIDLFKEIEKAYNGLNSIFDNIHDDDLIFAFFPCVRFENQIIMSFQGNMSSIKNKTLEYKLEYDLKLHEELSEFYVLITKLVLVAIRKKIKLIIENPYSTQHYLVRYWALKASFIDSNRIERGDFFKKPTQYFFINCQPKNNFIFECVASYPKKLNHHCSTLQRSMITPDYANRFIREYLINQEECKE